MRTLTILGAIFIWTGLAWGQHLTSGNTDVVGLDNYPESSYLLECEDQGFFWISGTYSANASHPLLPTVTAEMRNLYFMKYDQLGHAQKSNVIRGSSYPTRAFSFRGGLTLLAKAYQNVSADGNVLNLNDADHLEFIASYDKELGFVKIINIWNLAGNQYVSSDARMDPVDGSLYVYGVNDQPLELNDYGMIGEGLSQDYFYAIKYSQDLAVQWVYTAGFDLAQTLNNFPYFPELKVHPMQNGSSLVTGFYESECAPLIHGQTLAPHVDGYGTFALKLDAAGNSEWVIQGSMQGWGYESSLFKAFPLTGGDIVLTGATETGYYRLGAAEFIFPGGENYMNHFAFRLNASGQLRWIRPLQSMGPYQAEKKGTQSDEYSDEVYYDALNWRNKILYLTGYYGEDPDFEIADRSLDKTYMEGIFVASIDLETGKENWGYGLTSDHLEILGIDMDRTGNVSLMGMNNNSQHLEGVDELPLESSRVIIHLGLDYRGQILWYNNVRMGDGTNFYNLQGADLEVLPDGQVFSSLYLLEANSLVLDGKELNQAQAFPYSSWLVGLNSEIKLGGRVEDEFENPVNQGYVKAIKSAPWGTYPVIDSVWLQEDGTYLFESLYPGNYAILVYPDRSQFPETVPTYFGDRAGWKGARFHDLYPEFNSNIVNIRLEGADVLTPQDGSGQLSGTVNREEEDLLKSTQAKPAKKTGVILLGKVKKSTMAGDVVAYVETDENGMFIFEHVPDGEYELHVEVPGLEMLEIHEVSIAGNKIIEGLDYTVSEDGIYTYGAVGVDLTENKELRLYPNPGKGLIMMDLPGRGSYDVRVFSTNGKLVRNRHLDSGGGMISLDIRDQDQGFYLIQVKGPQVKAHLKYVLH